MLSSPREHRCFVRVCSGTRSGTEAGCIGVEGTSCTPVCAVGGSCLSPWAPSPDPATLAPLPSACSAHARSSFVNASTAASEVQDGRESDVPSIAPQGAFVFPPSQALVSGPLLWGQPPTDITAGVTPAAPPMPAGAVEALFFPIDVVVQAAVDHAVAAIVERVAAAVHTVVATLAATGVEPCRVSPAAAEARLQGAFPVPNREKPSARSFALVK